MSSVIAQPGDLGTITVAIIGAGPAGRVLGAHLAKRGVATAIVDPDPGRPWPNTYGIWLDEIPDEGFDIPLSHIFEDPRVHLPKRSLNLGRTYGLIDRQALQRALDQTIVQSARAHLVEGRVQGVRHEIESSTIDLEGGASIEAAIVIDASGGKGGFVRSTDDTEPGYQRAFGIEARLSESPFDGESMSLMDYRPIEQGPPSPSPTFLYAMDLGDGRYFVEETVLVEEEPTAMKLLEERLYARLEERGVEVLEVLSEERCHIPMGTSLPDFSQPMLAFGAAAGFVHPSTGYQIGRMLHDAGPLAEIIADGFEHRESRKAIARRGWSAIWPQPLMRARKLLVFGRDVLTKLDEARLSSFFDTFFGLPDEQWRDFMSGTAAHTAVASTMWQFFTEAGMDMRRQLMRRGVMGSPQILQAFTPLYGRGGPDG